MARRRIATRVAELMATRRTAEQTERVANERAAERRALSEAETARRDLDEVVRHLPVGVIMAEAPSGRLILGNEEVERVWRHPFLAAAQIADYGAYRGFHPADRRPYRPEEWPLARSVRDGEVVEREEIEILRGDGTFGTIEVSSIPLHDRTGEILAAVVAFGDVTERKRAERTLRLLAATGELLDAALDVEQTIERIASLAVPALADVCAVYLAEGEGEARRIAVAAADPSLDELVADMVRRGPIDALDERSPIARVIRDGRSVLLETMRGEALADIAEDADQAALLMRLGVSSTVVAPLTARGVTLGAVLMGAFGERRPLERDDIPLIEEVARRAALALDNARLYGAEQRNAELLQRSLLPERLPELGTADATARYVASGARTYVGGDWYDVIPLPDGSTGLVIGDVAGHGLRAAAAMGRLRSALRAFSLDDASPARVLARLNEFERRLGEREMATVLYAVHDAGTATIRFASAGHLAPFVVEPGGEVTRLEGGRSLPIGVRGRVRYEDATAALPPGATLLLYTDGLVERRDAPLDTGLARVERAVAGPAEDLDALCEGVLAAALGGERPDDDVALLAFRPHALDARRLDVHVVAEPESLAALRQRLRAWLRASELPDETVEEVVTACGEACANAVEHAYGPGDARLEVSGRVEDGRLELVVADRGRWRGTRSEDRGLGLTIMRALMDDVAIEADDAGTRVRMRRRLPSGQRA